MISRALGYKVYQIAIVLLTVLIFRWEEFLNGVNNIHVLVEQLKVELEELIENQNIPAIVSYLY